METSLHRDLKLLYAGEEARFEVRLGSYRIDAISDGRLVEVQHGSLAAIRDKVAQLLQSHPVLVVKPIVAQKLLVTRDPESGAVVRRRRSPKRGQLLDLFDELVHFTRVFPHPQLSLEVVLVEVEEWRIPGHGRRRRWRESDFEVEDQKLLAIQEVYHLRTAADLRALLPPRLPQPFHTGDLAERLEVSRGRAQRIAYCLRNMGAVREAGKQGNARLYRLPARRRKTVA